MNKFTYALTVPVLAATLFLGACSGSTPWNNQPVTPVPTNVDTQIQNDFMALDMGLVAVQLIPGIPANLVTQAKAVDSALQAAYAQYKSDPTASNQIAIIQSALAAAKDFMAHQGAEAAKAGKAYKASHPTK